MVATTWWIHTITYTMSWQVRSFAFIFFLAFAATACNDDGKIGPELDPQDSNYGVNFTTVNIPSLSTVLVDSFRSTATDRMLAGTYSDSEVGNVTVTAYAELTLPRDNLSFGIPAYGYDSMVLHLKVDYFYGDTTSDFNFSIHRITEPIDEEEEYYQDASFTYDATPLGTATIDPEGIIGDELTITLDSAQVRQIFYLMSGQAELSNQQSFESYFNGLAIVADGAAKGVIGFQMSYANFPNSYLRLHYRSTTDTTFVDFKLDDNEGNLNGFSVDRSTSTYLQGFTNSYAEVPSSSTGGFSFSQSGTGLRTGFGIPDLKYLNTEGLILNRAIMVVTPDQSQALPPPDNLFINIIDQNTGVIGIRSGFTVTVQANSSNINGVSNPARLQYNADKKNYSVDVTDYVQARMFNTVPDAKLLLSPTLNAKSVNLLKLNSTDGIKLELYYTDLD